MIYTIKINTKISDPEKCCSYLNDAKFFTKGSSDWENKCLIFKNIQPCLFINGQVINYLNKNNFLEDANNYNQIDIPLNADFMIEFPYFGFQIYKEDSNIFISITDEYNKKNFNYSAFSRNNKNDLKYFYHGAFKGYIDENNKLRSIINVQPTAYHNIYEFKNAAKNQGLNYHESLYSHILAIQCLYLIKYCNLNGQQALGKGYCEAKDTDYNNSITTGNTIKKGMCFGDPNDGLKQMKLFGIEDFWGNIWEWVDGIFIDNNYNIFLNNNYIDNIKNKIILNKHLSEQFPFFHPHGYIKNIIGTTELGFLPIEWTEINNIFWSDFGCIYPNSVCHFGDRWSNGNRVGPFRIGFHGNGKVKNRTFGGRLCYH